jgi:hypothetical protein
MKTLEPKEAAGPPSFPFLTCRFHWCTLRAEVVMGRKIIFVYNADSGIVNALKDAVEKNVSPETYSCNLCAVTFGTLRMKPEWKRFVRDLPVEVEFLHRDEYTEEYGNPETGFPAAFLVPDGGNGENPRLLISPEEMNRCENLDEMKKLVLTAVEEKGVEDIPG